MKHFHVTVLMFLITLLISACGQSGGLYLPNNPPPADAQQQNG